MRTCGTIFSSHWVKEEDEYNEWINNIRKKVRVA